MLLLPFSLAANPPGGTLSSVRGGRQPPPPPPPVEQYPPTIFQDHGTQAAFNRTNAVGPRSTWRLSSSANGPRISIEELDGQLLQLDVEPKSAWRKQVEQSLFQQSRVHNRGAQQSRMHPDIPVMDAFRTPGVEAQGKKKGNDSIASDPQNIDPWRQKVEQSLWQLHQKWMELSTLIREEHRRIDAPKILLNPDGLSHHTGVASEVVVGLEEQSSPLNDDIPVGDLLNQEDAASYLRHFLFCWLALPMMRQHDAPTRIPRMVRRKVAKTRALPRRTILSDLQDWDLDDDEFDLLLMDLKLPSMLEEEYSVYEYDTMEEIGDELDLSLPFDVLDEEAHTAVTEDDDEETNAFLKASSAPESWQVVFGELGNEFDSGCDDEYSDPETSVIADHHGESSDHDWKSSGELPRGALSRDADHHNSPIDTESSNYIVTRRRPPPPPVEEDEDDDSFNDLERQLLEETGAQFEIELDWHREDDDEDEMDEDDWRVLQTSAASNGFGDSSALFGDDEDLDRFNADDEWTEVDPYDEDSIAIVPVEEQEEEEEEMSLGESASTRPPSPVLQKNAGYPPSFVPPPPGWVAPHSLQNSKEMRQAPMVRPPSSRNTLLPPLQRPPPPNNLPPPPPTRRLPPPLPPLFTTSVRPPIAAGLPPPPPEQRRQTH